MTGEEFMDDARRNGATVSSGPVPEDFTAAWGTVPMMRGKHIAHYWTANRPKWMKDEVPDALYGLHSACGLRALGTRQVPLLGAGNMPYCARCENVLMKRQRTAG